MNGDKLSLRKADRPKLLNLAFLYDISRLMSLEHLGEGIEQTIYICTVKLLYQVNLFSH